MAPKFGLFDDEQEAILPMDAGDTELITDDDIVTIERLAAEEASLDHRSTMSGAMPNQLFLELTVCDRDTIAELHARTSRGDRDEFALQALRIGVLALRQARGQLDADLIRRETQQMLGTLATQLTGHAQQVQDRLAGSLKEYFDPDGGRFPERLDRLIKQDGDLEQLLRRQIGGTDSELCRTLMTHLGQQSPLMKLLSPTESEGLLHALRETVEGQLTVQRDRVLREFSLDNKEGALARLVVELTTSHGELQDKLEDRLDEVVKEFSLDEENSALSRLVRNVDHAQRTISSEFSLDNERSAFSRMKLMLQETSDAIHGSLTLDDEASALARLKRELMTILGTHAESNQKFQEEVKVALGKMVAKREEEQRSTRHGLVFEDAVGEYLTLHTQRCGDVCERTGNTTGLIRHSRIGDFVVELGPESCAPAARVVVEAKEEAGYSLVKAREELELARQNRAAQLGLFVFSSKSAPAGLQPFARYGSDVIVVWDAEDSRTDLYLQAGLEMTRALCVRSHKVSEAQQADFTAMDAAILEIEKRTTNLEQISTWASTIHSNSEKILDHVRIARKSLEKQIATLQEKVGDLKQSVTVVET